MTGGDGVTSCMACGRPLRDEESRRLRLGPVCRERLREQLAPRPRIVGTRTAVCHPQALPQRPGQIALDWDDEDDEPDPYGPRPITDVPTGALL
ncbi:DUF6011 domain-containing protein [Streptomyces sp. NPDC127113]|uniref:DUF6011 domain-containing protein n=1 Tax=Streptomyces sp. NPDC127113 TaxID=3345365 RepID=UPI00362D36DD